MTGGVNIMIPSLSISTTFDLDANIRCLRRSFCVKPYELILLLMPIPASLVAFLFGWVSENTSLCRHALGLLFYACVLYVVLLVWFLLVLPLLARRRQLKEVIELYGSSKYRKVFHFFPWGFVTKTEKEEFRWNYADLKKIRETDDYIILCFGRMGFQYIDRRDIPNYEEFRQFMQDRLRDGGIKSYHSDNGTPL